MQAVLTRAPSGFLKYGTELLSSAGRIKSFAVVGLYAPPSSSSKMLETSQTQRVNYRKFVVSVHTYFSPGVGFFTVAASRTSANAVNSRNEVEKKKGKIYKKRA